MRIYCSGLPYTFIEGDLAQLFETYGQVSDAYIAKDKENKLSLGYGFVQMPVYQAGLDAIKSLDGRMVNGRPLKVSEAINKK